MLPSSAPNKTVETLTPLLLEAIQNKDFIRCDELLIKIMSCGGLGLKKADQEALFKLAFQNKHPYYMALFIDPDDLSQRMLMSISLSKPTTTAAETLLARRAMEILKERNVQLFKTTSIAPPLQKLDAASSKSSTHTKIDSFETALAAGNLQKINLYFNHQDSHQITSLTRSVLAVTFFSNYLEKSPATQEIRQCATQYPAISALIKTSDEKEKLRLQKEKSQQLKLLEIEKKQKALEAQRQSEEVKKLAARMRKKEIKKQKKEKIALANDVMNTLLDEVVAETVLSSLKEDQVLMDKAMEGDAACVKNLVGLRKSLGLQGTVGMLFAFVNAGGSHFIQHQIRTMLSQQGILDLPVDSDKNTLLHLATIDRDNRIVQLLMHYGANPHIKNACGFSAIHLCLGAVEYYTPHLTYSIYGARVNQKALENYARFFKDSRTESALSNQENEEILSDTSSDTEENASSSSANTL